MPRLPVLFVSHGGGPLPLLNDSMHAPLTKFLKSASKLSSVRPHAIVCVTAHWESKSSAPCISVSPSPSMLYDYGGFPPESYKIKYPAPGPPATLIDRVSDLLTLAGIGIEKDDARGFDHGTFVPLKLMYPEADIPVLQLSILSSMEPGRHWDIGQALSPLRDEGVLILGSGFTFHNMHSFMTVMQGRGSSTCSRDKTDAEKYSVLFDDWLVDACSKVGEERKKALIDWSSAPSARAAHPREEHLLPLFVAAGAASDDVGLVINQFNMGQEELGEGRGIRASSFIFE